MLNLIEETKRIQLEMFKVAEQARYDRTIPTFDNWLWFEGACGVAKVLDAVKDKLKRSAECDSKK